MDVEWATSNAANDLPAGKESLVRIKQEVGWAPGLVCTLWSRDRSLVPAGNRTLAVQPVARRYINWAMPSYCAYHKILKFAWVLLASDFKNIHSYYSPTKRRQNDWWTEVVDLDHSTVPSRNIWLHCSDRNETSCPKFCGWLQLSNPRAENGNCLAFSSLEDSAHQVLWILMSFF
jgi:hypothetical protein